MSPIIGYYYPFPPGIPGLVGPDGEPLRSEPKPTPPKRDTITLEFCDKCGCTYVNGCSLHERKAER